MKVLCSVVLSHLLCMLLFQVQIILTGVWQGPRRCLLLGLLATVILYLSLSFAVTLPDSKETKLIYNSGLNYISQTCSKAFHGCQLPVVLFGFSISRPWERIWGQAVYLGSDPRNRSKAVSQGLKVAVVRVLQWPNLVYLEVHRRQHWTCSALHNCRVTSVICH